MVDWTKTAFVFPGQGSQQVGMGKDFAEAYPIARETFEQADDILGFSLSSMCFDGPEADLNETNNTQPALYVTSIAILRVLEQKLPDMKPAFVAGHSLGELTALTAAGALSFEDGVRLVRERGRLMYEAGNESPGAMAALLGLEAAQVRELCEKVAAETQSALVLANDNCPGQIVISGDVKAIDHSLEVASEMGAKRAVKLAVSIAAHSPLMASASAEFQRVLGETTFSTPNVPVYANVTASPLTDVAAIREELNGQLTQSVRWTESVQAMIDAGADTFVEIGSGDVLSGLIRRIDRKATRIAINNVDSIAGVSES